MNRKRWGALLPTAGEIRDGDLVIAADFGTSGVKLAAVGPTLEILAKSIAAYPLSLPQAGQAEQNPEDWWDALIRAVADLAGKVDRLSERASAIVFCAQMCGVLPVDRDGAPLRPCLIWLDKRSAQLSRDLVGGFPSVLGYNVAKLVRWVRTANGAPSLNGMDPTGKMLWLKRHEPETFERSHKLLDVKDWLIHRATGRFTMTADSANLTWLMDTRPGREGWSQSLSRMAGLPLDKLPEIVEGSSIVGELTERAARELGLKKGLPVIGGSGDATATAVGSGAVADGALHVYAGTSGWVSGFFDRRIISIPHSFATIASSVNHRPLLIATQESAGTAFSWLARLLGGGEVSDDMLAEFLEDVGARTLHDPLFAPWLAGERVPVDDDRLRGTFIGLTLQHDRQAIARSVLEGVAFNTRWAYSKVIKTTKVSESEPLPLVGGAGQNPVFAQLLADTLKRPVVVGEPRYAGVLGSAAMAAGALGWYADTWAAAKAIGHRADTVYEPDREAAGLLEARYARLDKLRGSLVKLYRNSAVPNAEGGKPA